MCKQKRAGRAPEDIRQNTDKSYEEKSAAAISMTWSPRFTQSLFADANPADLHFYISWFRSERIVPRLHSASEWKHTHINNPSQTPSRSQPDRSGKFDGNLSTSKFLQMWRPLSPTSVSTRSENCVHGAIFPVSIREVSVLDVFAIIKSSFNSIE